MLPPVVASALRCFSGLPFSAFTMAWRSSGASNAELVQNLCHNGMINDPAVEAAFLAVDRAHYIRAGVAAASAYQDAPQRIGFGATISAPHMHALAVHHLLPFVLPSATAAPRTVLDVGSGSGYLTHVLCELAVGGPGSGTEQVSSSPLVIGIEHIPQLRDQAEANMRRSQRGRELLDSGRVRFIVGDGRQLLSSSNGLGVGGKHSREPELNSGADSVPVPSGALPHSTASASASAAASPTPPLLFDAIHVGAAAKELHQALLDQLRAPGRIFIPLEDAADSDGDSHNKPDWDTRSQHIWIIDKDAEGRVTQKQLFGVRYVPLTGPTEEK